MKRAVVFLSLALLCPSSLPAQSPKHLLLGLASISGGIDILYVTKKTGAFKRNGLEVDFILFQGGSQALQVLLAGDVKMISGGGGTAAQRARMKGAGNVLVATYTPTMPFSIYVNNKIQDIRITRIYLLVLGAYKRAFLDFCPFAALRAYFKKSRLEDLHNSCKNFS